MSHPYFKSLVGQTTSVANIFTGKAGLGAVLLTGDGTNVPTIDIYDNTAGSGTKIFTATLPITTRSQFFHFAHPVRADIGLSVVITGTGAIWSIYYL